MPHILIVEDNPSLSLAYSSVLEQEGYEVTVISRVPEALIYLETNTPDLILLDVLLPAMNGLELLHRYDVLQAHKDVRVIVFSNLTDSRTQHEAEVFGAKLYLTKTLTAPDTLVASVRQVLAS